MSNGGGYGGSLPLITVVEYLETSMSRDLLGKFPDNSSFDFDYTQSSIWSPLLPHAATPDVAAVNSRRLSFSNSSHGAKFKKLAAGIKRKVADAVLSNVGCGRSRMKRKKRKRSSIGFSPVASSPKLVGKVMKAAGEYLKKQKKTMMNSHLTL